MAITQQESHMPHDAIAHRAESRQRYKQPLLEDRGHGVIEITSLGKTPELLYEFWRCAPRAKEIWKHAEAAGDFSFKRGA